MNVNLNQPEEDNEMALMRLTLADVRRAAREYYANGKLAAQHRLPQNLFEMADGHRCAIGAALTEEVLMVAKQRAICSIVGLWAAGIVDTPKDDEHLMIQLMEWHDHWAVAESNCAGRGAVMAAKTRFLELLWGDEAPPSAPTTPAIERELEPA